MERYFIIHVGIERMKTSKEKKKNISSLSYIFDFSMTSDYNLVILA